MKKVLLLITVLTFSIPNLQATPIKDKATPHTTHGQGESFIFREDGVTFAVYPDGEFDFYMDTRVNLEVSERIGNVGITFNSGYNYNPYLQYDAYGAVIQIEHIPIYYDYYGRVSQIGSIAIKYTNKRIHSIGGLYMHYKGRVLSYCTGYINRYNRYYVYQPFHRYFVRPTVTFCNVSYTPYRRHYTPVQHVYPKSYICNPGSAERTYKNDQRISVRNNTRSKSANLGRSNSVIVQNSYRKRAILSHPGTVTKKQTTSIAKRNPGNTRYKRNNSTVIREVP